MSGEIKLKIPFFGNEVDFMVKVISKSGKGVDFEAIPEGGTLSLSIPEISEILEKNGCKIDLSSSNVVACNYKGVTVTIFSSGKLVLENVKSDKPEEVLDIIDKISRK